jgi:hypothetical protein
MRFSAAKAHGLAYYHLSGYLLLYAGCLSPRRQVGQSSAVHSTRSVPPPSLMSVPNLRRRPASTLGPDSARQQQNGRSRTTVSRPKHCMYYYIFVIPDLCVSFRSLCVQHSDPGAATKRTPCFTLQRTRLRLTAENSKQPNIHRYSTDSLKQASHGGPQAVHLRPLQFYACRIASGPKPAITVTTPIKCQYAAASPNFMPSAQHRQAQRHRLLSRRQHPHTWYLAAGAETATLYRLR